MFEKTKMCAWLGQSKNGTLMNADFTLIFAVFLLKILISEVNAHPRKSASRFV